MPLSLPTRRTAVLLLALLIPSTGSAAETSAYTPLLGMWSNDCSSAMETIIITPDYQAIIRGDAGSNRATALGKIQQFKKNGKAVSIIFSKQYLHQKGDRRPTYQLLDD